MFEYISKANAHQAQKNATQGKYRLCGRESKMTDEEIRTSYRDAKHKKMQIRILSELTLKPKEEICRIVGENRFLAKRKRAVAKRWTKEEVAFLFKSKEEGRHFSQIAEILQRPYASVASKYYDVKRTKGVSVDGS